MNALERVLAISRHELAMLSRDPSPLVALVVMPLLIIAFLEPSFRTLLAQEGYPGADGTEQAVPGLTVMFAFFVVSFGGLTLFREHGWGTWERLQVSGVRTVELLLGKAVPLALLLLVQFAVVFAVSALLLGFRIRGPLVGVLLVWGALAVCVLALTAMMFALCRSDQQMIAWTNITTMLFGGFGGALVPVAALPGWASALGPATPSYWAIRGFRSVVLDGAGPAGVLLPVAALLGFAGLFAAVASLRLRADARKASLRH